MPSPTTMYDAVNLDAIPQDALMVAGYVNGAYVTFPVLRHRFPKARAVSISVQPSMLADVLDVENGDARPHDVPGWTNRARSVGRRPVVYTSISVWAACVAECRARGVAPPFWWAADWTGEPHLPDGAVACQWASPTTPPKGSTGIGYDVSVVSPNFPSRYRRRVPMVIDKALINRVAGFTRQLAAVLGLVVSIGNAIHLPLAVRTALLSISGGLLWIEHHASASKPAAAPRPGV